MSWLTTKILQQIGLSSVVTSTGAKLRNDNNFGVQLVAVRSFKEAGAGVGSIYNYSATVVILSGGYVQDVVWKNVALWSATTTAGVNVGDGDDSDGFITVMNVKTNPASNINGGGGISVILNPAVSGIGAYGGNGKHYPSGGTITATVSAVGTGTSGQSVMYVMIAYPNVVAAVGSH